MTNDYIHHLLEKMTTEEKAAQLLQLATPFFKGSKHEGKITGPMEEMGVKEKVIQSTGSVLGASGAKETINIQKEHLKHNRLGIPLLFMADVVHGFKTIFPIPLAMGCSWDLHLAKKSAEVAAKEASVSGVHVSFAPMVDLVRDPRWGRVMETTGEDPYLNSRFAEAQVEGYQGNSSVIDMDHVAACVKHFAGYGAAEAGRDYNTVDISERELRENYLPAYQAALQAGSELVMTSFNTIEGIPASGNKRLMRDILRKEWGFNGVIISDWGAVKELIPHGVAADASEAAKLAIEAGVDIEMMTTTYIDHLVTLIDQGRIKEDILDEAVLRILQLKDKLGLFENPYRAANEEQESLTILHADHRKLAKELAIKSSVLLKNNNNTLPLDTNQKIALIGPFSTSNDILGPWSWQGDKNDAVTLDKGLKNKTANLSIAKGCDVDSIDSQEIDKAIEIAKNADVVILGLGERSEMSGEAGSRANIQLPKEQLTLIKAISELNKPVVTVLFNGRPLDLHGVIEYSDAILEAWFPGTEGGSAIADLLYGDETPTGKLSMSFPYSVGQVPVYYNHYNTGRPKDAPNAEERFSSKFLDIPNEPLYPFGYGLSYTSFSYGNVQLSSSVFQSGESIEATVEVINNGTIAAEEIVQLYIRDHVGQVVRPLKELKGFKKVFLHPKDSKKVTFTIHEQDLAYHHSDLSFYADKGDFTVFIGTNSVDVKAATFRLV
ncbi:beta-glucosidase BglX [Oceanobacillus sp. 1P07AA]|uniref:beta-glucosidase BglX n=1 Tax=Oceanobacillus sp. 1P07AA TaxID=3132293 RepID=UPI0039A49A2C